MPEFSLPDLLLRLRVQLYRWLRLSDMHATLAWACCVGVLGALATMAFREGIGLVQHAMTGHDGNPVDIAMQLPWYWRVAVPAGGGCIAGLLLIALRRYGGATTRSDYMEAISIGDGSLPVRSSLLSGLSSLFTIASGGSIGREGSMVQLAALSASLFGRWRKMDAGQLRLLVACGAAAGITSAYNAPIAGAFFISEIVLGSVAMESFGPILVASVVANVTMRQFPDYQPTYEMPIFPLVSPPELLLFAVLGILCGFAAPRFLGMLEAARKYAVARMPSAPLRLTVGGLIVGVVSIGVPQVWGNGYSIVNQMLHESLTWQLVLLILFWKMFATLATVGSGAAGGIFTPTLFVGAGVGFLFGAMLHWLPFAVSAPSAYAVVGMGAFLAAATSAPLMAILMIFEMTLNYQVMLPLMLAVVLAYFVARATADASMYEVIQKRRKKERERFRLQHLHVSDLIKPAETVVLLQADRTEMTRLFLMYPVKYLYVVDDTGIFQGVVALQDIANDLLQSGGSTQVTAETFLKRTFVRLHPDMILDDALAQFLAFRGERLPVVEAASGMLLGIADKTSVLDACMRLGEVGYIAPESP